ncbi:MAG TPA: TVP38/TMEM64 family protein [Kiloniellales bacterium]|nr:TVP38/TMEM64 family protein [Kiloniellales bacterium]
MAVPGEPAPEEGVEATTARRPGWRRWLPLAVLFVLSVSAYLYLRSQGIGFDSLAQHRAWMMAQVEEHGIFAGLALFAIYVVVTALSLPLGSVLTVFAGFLFGTVEATLWVVAGATLGSIAVFLAARGVLREVLEARAGPWLQRMERGFREDALSYLLVLRLLPIFPFWLVNLVPALLGVPFGTYVLATALGIIPGTVIFASLGNGLGAVLDRGETPDFSILLDPALLLPLLGLCLLALLPVIFKRWRRRHAS